LQQWRSAGKPELYVVALDMLNSFDTLQHDKVKQVVDKILTKHSYSLIKYWYTRPFATAHM
jgi:hypothetical protein